MKRDCWASQSPSRNASLSPLVLGRNLWRSAEWLPALLIILCSSSIVSLYRAAMVEGWIFPWFEYLGQQQQRVGALVASSTGQDVFGKSVLAHFTWWGNRTINSCCSNMRNIWCGEVSWQSEHLQRSQWMAQFLDSHGSFLKFAALSQSAW